MHCNSDSNKWLWSTWRHRWPVQKWVSTVRCETRNRQMQKTKNIAINLIASPAKIADRRLTWVSVCENMRAHFSLGRPVAYISLSLSSRSSLGACALSTQKLIYLFHINIIVINNLYTILLLEYFLLKVFACDYRRPAKLVYPMDGASLQCVQWKSVSILCAKQQPNRKIMQWHSGHRGTRWMSGEISAKRMNRHVSGWRQLSQLIRTKCEIEERSGTAIKCHPLVLSVSLLPPPLPTIRGHKRSNNS